MCRISVQNMQAGLRLPPEVLALAGDAVLCYSHSASLHKAVSRKVVQQLKQHTTMPKGIMGNVGSMALV